MARLRVEFDRVAVLFKGAGEHMPVIFVSRAVLGQIEHGALQSEAALSWYQRELLAKLKAIKTANDHQQFGQFFERYSEALTYLLISRRGVPLHRIEEQDDKTPDFSTQSNPEIYFEVKALDFAAGQYAHDRHGKSSATEVIEHSSRPGLNTTVNAIRPHGAARTPLEAIQS